MKKLLFVIKKIFRMDFKSFFTTINKIHKRSGKNRIYSLTDTHIKEIFEIGIEHISEQDPKIQQDLINLDSNI